MIDDDDEGVIDTRSPGRKRIQESENDKRTKGGAIIK